MFVNPLLRYILSTNILITDNWQTTCSNFKLGTSTFSNKNRQIKSHEFEGSIPKMLYEIVNYLFILL